MRSVTFFLLSIAVLAACGGKVVFDQGAGGASGASGATSTSVGFDCTSLIASYNAAIVSAAACNPCLGAASCTVMAQPICDCPTPIDASNQDLVNQVAALHAQLESLGCDIDCPPMDDCQMVTTTPGPGVGVTCASPNGDNCSGNCQFDTLF